MISTAPSTDAYRVLQVFADLDEPTSGEVARLAGVDAHRVPRIIARLREGGYLTGTEYRISHPALLTRRGCAGYASLGRMALDDDADDYTYRIVVALRGGPMSRLSLATALGCATNDGAFARALKALAGQITNYPALTPEGRAKMEAKP